MYAMDFAQVGANIRRVLDLKGLTQQSLADRLGISKQVMNKIIKGSKAINVYELSQIAKVLNLSTDELLTVDSMPAAADNLSFMGRISDTETLKKINLIRTTIDEIHMLEDLLNE